MDVLTDPPDDGPIVPSDDERAPDGLAGRAAETGERADDGTSSQAMTDDGQFADGQVADGQFADRPAADGQFADGPAHEGQPIDGQAADGRAQDGQPFDGQAADGQAQDGQPVDGQAADGQAVGRASAQSVVGGEPAPERTSARAARDGAQDATAQAAAAAARAVRAVLDRALAAAPRLGGVRVVCIDGPAGSGKSTAARAVASAAADRGVDAVVVHLDDLYEGWSGLEGSLWPRLSAQVLEPLRRGLPGRFQRYDWPTGRFADWVDVPVPTLLVLEGCGSARRESDALAVLRVWVEAPDDLRLRRGLERDGDAARADWLAWMRTETAHFTRERTRERADVRLDAVGRPVPD